MNGWFNRWRFVGFALCAVASAFAAGTAGAADGADPMPLLESRELVGLPDELQSAYLDYLAETLAQLDRELAPSRDSEARSARRALATMLALLGPKPGIAAAGAGFCINLGVIDEGCRIGKGNDFDTRLALGYLGKAARACAHGTSPCDPSFGFTEKMELRCVAGNRTSACRDAAGSSKYGMAQVLRACLATESRSVFSEKVRANLNCGHLRKHFDAQARRLNQFCRSGGAACRIAAATVPRLKEQMKTYVDSLQGKLRQAAPGNARAALEGEVKSLVERLRTANMLPQGYAPCEPGAALAKRDAPGAARAANDAPRAAPDAPRAAPDAPRAAHDAARPATQAPPAAPDAPRAASETPSRKAAFAPSEQASERLPPRAPAPPAAPPAAPAATAGGDRGTGAVASRAVAAPNPAQAPAPVAPVLGTRSSAPAGPIATPSRTATITAAPPAYRKAAEAECVNATGDHDGCVIRAAARRELADFPRLKPKVTLDQYQAYVNTLCAGKKGDVRKQCAREILDQVNQARPDFVVN